MKRQPALLSLGLACLICFCGSQLTADAQPQQDTEAVRLARNKDLVRRWIEDGFNKRSLAVVDALFAEEVIINGQKIARAGIKQSMTRHLTAFPDLYVTITELIGEGDKVNIWYSVKAAQKGEFEGISPTGKQVNWSGCDLFRIESGKIVEARFISDLLGLLRQLGAIVSPPPPQR